MKEKSIELELRAEVPLAEYQKVKKRLDILGRLNSETRRLSAMFFGQINKQKIDLRVRVTNGESEVVVKLGEWGSSDRTEVAQKIKSDQFLGLIKLFSCFNFIAKIGEREILNYVFPGDITVSLACTGPIAYIELECMSYRSEVEVNRKKLLNLAKQLRLKLFTSEVEFDQLCQRLTDEVDWIFHNTKKDYTKLAKLFKKYIR